MIDTDHLSEISKSPLSSFRPPPTSPGANYVQRKELGAGLYSSPFATYSSSSRFLFYIFDLLNFCPMYRYSRPRSRNNASSHLLFAVLLLAMLIGACIASPVPSESETDAPISPQVTGSDHLHVRRAFKQTVKKGFKKMKFWGSNEDGKDDDTVSAKEGGKDKTVLGYSYHVYNRRTSQYEWKYPDSTVGKDPIDKRAIQRLETIMAEFKDDRWVPYFPGPNYYRKFLNPQGNLFYYQGKTLIDLDKLNQTNPGFAFIPASTGGELHNLINAADESYRSKVTSKTGAKIETEEQERGLNLANSLIITELAQDRYAIFVARALIDTLMRSYPDNAAITPPLIDSLWTFVFVLGSWVISLTANVICPGHDMPAATWQNWPWVKELNHKKSSFVSTT
ncbi:hypothetical protein FB446DRAFT_803262 [Lentinula raphanica]|nr:hypothetical protein FB446DRAFT_803262 [Lentinula raphanica]